jgi:hypothetical protein
MKAPTRTLVLAIVLGLLIGSCGDRGRPESKSDVQASPTKGHGSARPTEPASPRPHPEWSLQNRLVGFQLHDGTAVDGSCELILVGERIEPQRAGVILSSIDGGRTARTVRSYPRALHLARVASLDGNVWAVGDTKAGKGLVLESADGGKSWRTLPLPNGIREVVAVAAAKGTVWIAANTTAGASVLSKPEHRERWREVLNNRRATLSAITVAGDTVVAVGKGTRGGIVLKGHIGTSDFEPVVPRAHLSAATAVAIVNSKVTLVGGYRTAKSMIEDAKAVLLRRLGGKDRWSQLRIPAGVQIADLLFISKSEAYALEQRDGGDEILASRNGGETWKPGRVGALQTLESLFACADGSVYVVAGSEVFRSRNTVADR